MMRHGSFFEAQNHWLGQWFRRAKGDKVDRKTPFARIRMRSANCIRKQREDIQMSLNDVNSLSHTKWNCKYHIVFAPKYRRKIFYHEKREAVGKILRQLCEWTRVKIVRAEVCPDHVHIAVYSLVIRQPE